MPGGYSSLTAIVTMPSSIVLRPDCSAAADASVPPVMGFTRNFIGRICQEGLTNSAPRRDPHRQGDGAQGSILRKLCLFMLPVLGALILQAAYGAVDLLVVGRFGSTSGLSAVSTGSQVLNLVTFVVTQLAMGVTVLIARYLGERCPEQIGAVIGGAAVVFAPVSALLFAVLVGLARPIAVVMQAPAEAVTLTASYVRICGGGTFFIVAYNLLSAIFRGLGDSRSPLLFVLVACPVNVAGDLLLVAGLGMDSVVVRSGFAYLKGFAPETIMTVVLFSMVGYFNGSGRRPVLCRHIAASAPRLCSAARIFFRKIPPIGNCC